LFGSPEKFRKCSCYTILIKERIVWGIARSPRSGISGSNLISDSYTATFFVTGNHNVTENEILSFRTLKTQQIEC
jgi:hypothetical protein